MQRFDFEIFQEAPATGFAAFSIETATRWLNGNLMSAPSASVLIDVRNWLTILHGLRIKGNQF